MKLGIIIEPVTDGRVADNYDELLTLTTNVDSEGFTSVWIAAHNFSLAAAVAEVTEHIRVGVLAKPALIHPLKTAEDAAVLDLLCNGRLLFGAEPLVTPEELRASMISEEQAWPRFVEAMDIITKSWSHDGFAYQGEFNRIPLNTSVTATDGQPFTSEPSEPPFVVPWRRAGMPINYISLQPKPLQIPHPPIFIAAADEQACRWAAGMGYSLILASSQNSRQLASAYWEELATSGRRREEVTLAIVGDVQVLEDEKPTSPGTSATDDGLSGSPDQVLEGIKAMVLDTGAFHLLCRIRADTTDQAATLRSLRLLASEIRPNLEM